MLTSHAVVAYLQVIGHVSQFALIDHDAFVQHAALGLVVTQPLMFGKFIRLYTFEVGN